MKDEPFFFFLSFFFHVVWNEHAFFIKKRKDIPFLVFFRFFSSFFFPRLDGPLSGSSFAVPSFSEINDRSYSQLLDVPLVVYSRRWAATCGRPCYTRF